MRFNFAKLQIESFHSLWVSSFWSRHEFATREEVEAEIPLFRRWYMYHYYPPALSGQGEYVRATINTQEQTIGFWHQASAEASWQLIKTRRFVIKETGFFRSCRKHH